MTDEQRMREQFQEWADSGMRYVTDRRNDGAYISTAADDAWEGFRAGQLARDAEVQELRDALGRLLVATDQIERYDDTTDLIAAADRALW